MLSKSLYNFTSASGGKLAIVGSPSVNLVDDAGHVLGAVDSSAYTIKNGVLTLDANAAGGLLHVGEHARVDVTYAVTNGTTVAPTSVYTIEIDGSLLRADGTAASETVSVAGLSGNYHVSGLGGDDRLFGGEGNDRLFGGGGNDVIVGGGGNDWLYGGAGNNALTGGGGADRFVITAGSNDTITDFRFADGDKIDLSGIDAIATNAAGTLDHFSFVAGGKFTGRAGQLIVAEDVAAADGAHWIVQGDTNGDGHADFALHVTSLDGHLLTAGDFLFG
nr:type I secretion C-terminal target domain-containing protein [Sphingomonas yunnanensis]